jgi:hypothetical protein
MLDQAARAEFERQYRLILIIYSATLASILIYLGIGFLMIQTLPSRVAGGSAGSLLITFYTLAAVLLTLILWLRKSWITPLPSLASAPGEALDLISRYRIGHIVVFVLCEVIILIGLVLLFLVGWFMHLVYFALLSLIMLTVSYPKKLE